MTKGNIVTDEEFDSIGVFAFYQQSSNGAAMNFNSHKFSTPDFMYNQKVSSTDGVVWSYSPVKYWPKNKGDTKDKANPANSSTIVNTITRKWSEFAPAISNLESGKAYKLYILIGMNYVNITASETAWEDVGIYSL